MRPTEAEEPKSVTGALSRWARRREQAGFAENIELCQPGPEPAEEPPRAWRPSLRLATTSVDAGETSRQLQENDAAPSKGKAQSATALVPSSHKKKAVKPAISGKLTESASSEKQGEDKVKPVPKTKSKARKASQEAEGEKNGLSKQVNQEEKVAEQPRTLSASSEKQSEDKAKPAPQTKSKARMASQEAEGEKNGLSKQVNQEEKMAEQPRTLSASSEKQSKDKTKPAPKTKSRVSKPTIKENVAKTQSAEAVSPQKTRRAWRKECTTAEAQLDADAAEIVAEAFKADSARIPEADTAGERNSESYGSWHLKDASDGADQESQDAPALHELDSAIATTDADGSEKLAESCGFESHEERRELFSDESIGRLEGPAAADREGEGDAFLAVCADCGAVHMVSVDVMAMGLDFRCGDIGEECEADFQRTATAPVSKEQEPDGTAPLSTEERKQLAKQHAATWQSSKDSRKEAVKHIQKVMSSGGGPKMRYLEGKVVTYKGEKELVQVLHPMVKAQNRRPREDKAEKDSQVET